MLLTKIPYFREIILMSFFCEHCNFSNCEVQSAGEIQEKGAKYVLKMDQLPDMERQIVKSDSAVFRIEDVDLEVPAGRGRLTNVEGILSDILRDLEKPQKWRKEEDPDLYEKVDTVVKRLIKMMSGSQFPYTISLDDPAGNSWIEPSPLDSAGKYARTEYARTPEQNTSLGLSSGEEDTDAQREAEEAEAVRQARMTELGAEQIAHAEVGGAVADVYDIVDGKMYSLPLRCPGCAKPANMNIQSVNIPYFKQVILTAVVCAHCGYRTNDVKTGGEYPDRGKRIRLSVESSKDLRRDILKSETCNLKIPECRVEVEAGTMGGRFTTVEGLLTQIRDDLRGNIYDVDDVKNTGGDSMPSERKTAWDEFFRTLDSAIRGEMNYTIVMDDPLANSYVQSFFAPEPDPQIKTEDYIRTAEEEDDLGLNDMKTHRNADGDYVKAGPIGNSAPVPAGHEFAAEFAAGQSNQIHPTTEEQAAGAPAETGQNGDLHSDVAKLGLNSESTKETAPSTSS